LQNNFETKDSRSIIKVADIGGCQHNFAVDLTQKYISGCYPQHSFQQLTCRAAKTTNLSSPVAFCVIYFLPPLCDQSNIILRRCSKGSSSLQMAKKAALGAG